MDRLILKKHRRKALNDLFEKYPRGFTVKQMVARYPKLYTKTKQATDFIISVRENERCIKLVREGVNCKYVRVVDTYKLLNELWAKSI